MIPHARLISRFLMIVTLGFFLLGCGSSKGVSVTGKLVFPKDVKLEKDDQVAITFLSQDPTHPGGTGIVNVEELTFVAQGTGGAGLAPGKYTVTVQITPYAGGPGSAKRAQQLNDGFNQAYNAKNSKLSYEVPAGGEQHITLDLVKGAVIPN